MELLFLTLGADFLFRAIMTSNFCLGFNRFLFGYVETLEKWEHRTLCKATSGFISLLVHQLVLSHLETVAVVPLALFLIVVLRFWSRRVAPSLNSCYVRQIGARVSYMKRRY